MSKVYEFLQECGHFFVLTANGEGPAGRPFGAVMELDGDLYLSTSDGKAVYRQLKENGRMQIVALKPGTREWIRIDGMAKECEDMEIKKKMLEVCPGLTKHFPTLDDPHYVVFQVKVTESVFY